MLHSFLNVQFKFIGIAIARALLVNPKLLLLDEATSALGNFNMFSLVKDEI